jgi:hypothetical protein
MWAVDAASVMALLTSLAAPSGLLQDDAVIVAVNRAQWPVA